MSPIKPLPYLLLALAMTLGPVACSSKKTAAEEQAEKVKAFQEQQKVRAYKAYKELVEKYPDSQFAPQAKDRLAKMGPVATPTPAKKK
jgi:outer membrane protein assembly factor BamD (BamD/ComL family)